MRTEQNSSKLQDIYYLQFLLGVWQRVCMGSAAQWSECGELGAHPRAQVGVLVACPTQGNTWRHTPWGKEHAVGIRNHFMDTLEICAGLYGLWFLKRRACGCIEHLWDRQCSNVAVRALCREELLYELVYVNILIIYLYNCFWPYL